MLTPAEFRAWTTRVALSAAATEVVEQVRRGDPVRRPRSSARNTAGRWPSRKMGMTIGYESGHVEQSAIVLMEHDARVLEFYDQPLVLRLDYRRTDGRRVVITHVPDFLVLDEGGAFIDEWKPERRLVELAQRMPERYRRTDEGWEEPAAAEAAEHLGLKYRLRSSAEIPELVVRNALFMRDHLSVEPVTAATSEGSFLFERVQSEPGIRLATLVGDPRSGGADVVLPLIAHGGLWVDPGRVSFADAKSVEVFLNAEQAAAWNMGGQRTTTATTIHSVALLPGDAIEWDGRPWIVVNAGHHEVVVREVGGGVHERLARDLIEKLIIEGRIQIGSQSVPDASRGLSAAASDRLREASANDLAEANHRLRLIDPASSAEATKPRRTLARWRSDYRAAEEKFGWGYLGLLPRPRPGNKQERLPPALYDLMDRILEAEYLRSDAPLFARAFGRLAAECAIQGLTVPSPSTLRRAIRARSKHETDRIRLGRRGAYESKPFQFYLSNDVPPHGDYPWQIVHIDHTKLDIELVDSLNPRHRLGRPWLTIAVDAFCRRILAHWLTFDPPSYRSVMMTLRATVRRHNRLGEMYVLDGGAEFESVYFESLLARYEIEKKSRPAAQPRYGPVVERLFGVSNTELIHSLPGNTKATKRVRTLTPETNPKNLAIFDLATLHEVFGTWAYETYDTRLHPALGRSPRDAYLAGLAATGIRPARLIPYDDQFVLASLPSTARGKVRVHAGRGVKLHHVHYWHQDFALAAVEGSDVPVRWDPLDLRHIFAFVGRHWVEAIAPALLNGPALTERELHLAVEELRQRDRVQGRTANVSEAKLRLYLPTAAAEEQLGRQRATDREQRRVALGLEAVIGAGRIRSDENEAEHDRLEGDQTSPPYALHYKKEYGNKDQHEYVEWFLTFAREVYRVLRDDGSFVINIGGAWKPGKPVRSLYHFRLLIALVDDLNFHLAQEFYWNNPAKMPTPAEWVNVRRIRVKDSIEPCWWMSKTPWPDASNRRVLAEYSPDMKKLIIKGFRAKTRPSGHMAKAGWQKDQGGSIPGNVLTFGNNDSNGRYLRACKDLGIKPHPARFPVFLPEFFMKFLSQPGDVVVDIFGGSMTAGWAAERLNRAWLGFDLDAPYIEASRHRFFTPDGELLSDDELGVYPVVENRAPEVDEELAA